MFGVKLSPVDELGELAGWRLPDGKTIWRRSKSSEWCWVLPFYGDARDPKSHRDLTSAVQYWLDECESVQQEAYLLSRKQGHYDLSVEGTTDGQAEETQREETV